MKIKLEELQCLRKKLGIYFLYDENKELVYVGYSGNMYTRILEHIAEGKKEFTFFKAIKFQDMKAAQFGEIYLISITKPKYNKLICEDFKHLWSLVYSTIDKEIDHVEMNIKTSFALKAEGDFNTHAFNKLIHSSREERMISVLSDMDER